MESFFGVEFKNLNNVAKKRLKKVYPFVYRAFAYLVNKNVVKQVTAVNIIKDYFDKTKTTESIRAKLARVRGVK